MKSGGHSPLPTSSSAVGPWYKLLCVYTQTYDTIRRGGRVWAGKGMTAGGREGGRMPPGPFRLPWWLRCAASWVTPGPVASQVEPGPGKIRRSRSEETRMGLWVAHALWRCWPGPKGSEETREQSFISESSLWLQVGNKAELGSEENREVSWEVRRAGTDPRIWVVAVGKEQRDHTGSALKEGLVGLGDW